MKWLTVAEAAELCDRTERAVQLAAENGAILSKKVPGKGYGGKQLLIFLDSLPFEAQERYYSRPAPDESKDYIYLTDEQREKVDMKLLAVIEYTDFKLIYHKRGRTKEFIRRFKESHPGFKINCGMLEDWVNKYAESGIDGLIDRRGLNNKGATTVTKEMQDVFMSFWLSDKKPSIQQCYDATAAYFNSNGIQVPHKSSFKRYLYSLPADVSARYREGKKFYNDNYMPSIFTDYESDTLYSNKEWIGDHHLFDVLVEYKGKVFRPWLSAWLDRKSRYVVGYVINMYEPNADIVLDSFAAAVKNCGIPEIIQIDNGKDYKAHDLFNVDNDYSLVSMLKAEIRVSNPYNAKAKSIERFFRTLESRNKLLPSYIGDRPENRPESMKGTNKAIAREDKAMDYDEFKRFIADSITIYHNTAHSGNGMNGSTPYEVYKNSFVKPMRILDESARRQLLMRTTRTATITKQGVKFAELPNVRYYTSTELLNYGIGKKVYARYDTANVKDIYIYSEYGNFICTASNDLLYGYSVNNDVNVQQIRENNKNQRTLRERTKSYYPDIETPSIIEIVENRARAFGLPDFSDVPQTNCTADLELDEKLGIVGTADTPAPDELTVEEETDILFNLGNIGKNAM